ncbi:MAG: peroxiredoxin [Verrucomicrobiae bacterium]|nr:peroxiredoxin [Verrucomicrobiae bacterium]
MKKMTAIIATIMTIGAMSMAKAGENNVALKPGDKAPVFEAKDQNSNTWKLTDFIGKKHVLLYFYPKDNTPGCTKQACSLRDNIGSFKSADVEVVGISADSASSHKNFIEQHGLNFNLLADPECKIIDLYGTRNPGKSTSRRVSFLINKEGKIVHIVENPDYQVHIEEMTKAIAGLKK